MAKASAIVLIKGASWGMGPCRGRSVLLPRVGGVVLRLPPGFDLRPGQQAGDPREQYEHEDVARIHLRPPSTPERHEAPTRSTGPKRSYARRQRRGGALEAVGFAESKVRAGRG